MADILGLIREILTLTSSVERLNERVERLATHVSDVSDRVIRLESREELVIEKTHTAAVMAVERMHRDVLDRLFRLEYSAQPLPPEKSLES